MTETPNTWDVGEEIPVVIFIADPVDNFGVPGQVAFITLSVTRSSDGKYWSGVDWVSSYTPQSVTEVDATNQPGLYSFTLPAAANTQADIYIFQGLMNNPALPSAAGGNYEIHRSRTTDVRVYEAEPTQ